MVIHRNVVLYKLLEDGIVFIIHLTFLCIVTSDELISLLGRELFVGGCEYGKYLTAVE